MARKRITGRQRCGSAANTRSPAKLIAGEKQSKFQKVIKAQSISTNRWIAFSMKSRWKQNASKQISPGSSLRIVSDVGWVAANHCRDFHWLTQRAAFVTGRR